MLIVACNWPAGNHKRLTLGMQSESDIEQPLLVVDVVVDLEQVDFIWRRK